MALHKSTKHLTTTVRTNDVKWQRVHAWLLDIQQNCAQSHLLLFLTLHLICSILCGSKHAHTQC